MIYFNCSSFFIFHQKAKGTDISYGMIFSSVIYNITKAGIHAHVVDDAENTPITIFVARDYHQTSPEFEKVVENDNIKVKIIWIASIYYIYLKITL